MSTQQNVVSNTNDKVNKYDFQGWMNNSRDCATFVSKVKNFITVCEKDISEKKYTIVGFPPSEEDDVEEQVKFANTGDILSTISNDISLELDNMKEGIFTLTPDIEELAKKKADDPVKKKSATKQKIAHYASLIASHEFLEKVQNAIEEFMPDILPKDIEDLISKGAEIVKKQKIE